MTPEQIRAHALQCAARTSGHLPLDEPPVAFFARVALFEVYIRLGMDGIEGMLRK